MAGSVVILLMKIPAEAMMVPEVNTVGNDRFSVSIMACLRGILFFSSW